MLVTNDQSENACGLNQFAKYNNLVPKNWRLQFGIRSLFLFTLLCAMFAWKFGNWYRIVVEEENAKAWFFKQELSFVACPYPGDQDQSAQNLLPIFSDPNPPAPPLWFTKAIGRRYFAWTHCIGSGGWIFPDQSICNRSSDDPFFDDFVLHASQMKCVGTIDLPFNALLNQKVVKWLPENSNLRTLMITGGNRKTNGAPNPSAENLACLHLEKWLLKCQALTCLELSGISISNADAEWLRRTDQITQISLHHVSLRARDYRLLAKQIYDGQKTSPEEAEKNGWIIVVPDP